jgi:hypothetical protein
MQYNFLLIGNRSIFRKIKNIFLKIKKGNTDD